jgi:hypothetical protein
MSKPYLFKDRDWLSISRALPDRMREEIASLEAQRVLTSSIEDLCDYFVKKYFVEVPELQKEKTIADQQEKEIDMSHRLGGYDSSPGRHYVKGTEIVISVPFSGDAELFKVRPNTFTYNPPCGEVRDQTLILRVSGIQLDAKVVRGQIDAELAQIEGWLSTLRSNVEPYNTAIRENARQQLEARRTKLLADQNLVSELGFPLRTRTDTSRTYAPPEVRRKIKPSLPVQSTQPFKPEPALTSEDYEHILTVLQNMAQVMERSPSAFNTIDEESLRSHFLVQLNGHYEGQATGETFNYSGKTDILIRVDGRNIFIGECKYWGGPQKLLETLDQLLSYSSWRDTKVALVIFNRRKNFSAVLSAILPSVQGHPNFKRSLPIEGETRFRVVLSHKDDPAREMLITILAFDVPTANEPEDGKSL